MRTLHFPNVTYEYFLPLHVFSGLKFVEKWSTDNVLSCETSVENQGIEGLKLTLDGSFNPSSG